MRREAWASSSAGAAPRTPAGASASVTPPGRRAPPQTEQVGKSRSAEARSLAVSPTASIFVYDLDSNIPAPDLEHGLHGLFSVF